MELQQHEGFSVWRDDLLPGGSKSRFLPAIIQGQREVVYGSPFCGGAAVSMSFVGKRLGVKVTVFYALRKELHRYQKIVLKNGGNIIQVPYGYMNNVQSKAKAYAAANGALFLPLGFDTQDAKFNFTNQIRQVKESVNQHFDEVWCATGSGMLARCLSDAFPASRIMAVAVGLASRNEAQVFNQNVTMLKTSYPFQKECKQAPPFPCNLYYDAKAWEMMKVYGRRGKNILFWNVMN